jgi:hypothetical protein
MPNSVNLEFAGDAKKLAAAGKDAQKAITNVGDSATASASDMAAASKETDTYTDRVGKLGAGVEGMSGAVDSAGAAVQALADLQSAGREKAMRLARAEADVEQAMIDTKQAAVDLEQATLDLQQAQTDGKQAGLDAAQAQIDVKQAYEDLTTATADYNTAVKENGANSTEARQALIDMDQAQQDLKQANLDSEQAQRDATQATIDAKQAAVDATQATRDGKDAQLDLNDAMSEANPTGLQQWADKIGMITPILSGLIGVVGLVTAAQWAWNAAQLASPTTWIIAGIAAVIAIIVVIATKTDWFQRAWKASWAGIKKATSATIDWFKKIPGWMGDIFGKVAGIITKPYRAAFNMIADAWNNTVGSLSFTVPGWVPGIGGNSIDVPNIPKFHGGGRVPGAPGTEMLAILQAGEEVKSPAGAAGGGGGDIVIRGDGSRLGDAILEIIRMAMLTRDGDPKAIGLRIS